MCKSETENLAFTYDAIGNPLSYNNGSAYTFTWQNGRQLASGTKGTTSFTYTYNSDGLRTRKVVGNKVYDYYWLGSQLAMMTITEGSNVITMKFYYDDNGTPIMLDYNGTLYYYITNLQGDVVGIADNYGVGATYRYDAWGNIIASDSASNVLNNAMTDNPLRYRGYIYDAETGFYYLQSRYYDPAIGRFINADRQLNGGFLGNNLYAYCDNNPVNKVDPLGRWGWNTVAGIAVGTVFVVAAATFVACTGGIGLMALGVADSVVKVAVAAGFTAGVVYGMHDLALQSLETNGNEYDYARTVSKTAETTLDELIDKAAPGFDSCILTPIKHYKKFCDDMGTLGELLNICVETNVSYGCNYLKNRVQGKEVDKEYKEETKGEFVFDIFKTIADNAVKGL